MAAAKGACPSLRLLRQQPDLDSMSLGVAQDQVGMVDAHLHRPGGADAPHDFHPASDPNAERGKAFAHCELMVERSHDGTLLRTQ